jgi:hypothetical protein
VRIGGCAVATRMAYARRDSAQPARPVVSDPTFPFLTRARSLSMRPSSTAISRSVLANSGPNRVVPKTATKRSGRKRRVACLPPAGAPAGVFPPSDLCGDGTIIQPAARWLMASPASNAEAWPFAS